MQLDLGTADWRQKRVAGIRADSPGVGPAPALAFAEMRVPKSLHRVPALDDREVSRVMPPPLRQIGRSGTEWPVRRTAPGAGHGAVPLQFVLVSDGAVVSAELPRDR
jgi:hypothetical protein